jgi:hypothetical protein
VRIETLPLILGILVALLGIGIVADAWTPDTTSNSRERRRSPRIERHRSGEALIGLGVLALGAAFIGRDSWRYSVLVVIIGAVFLLVGALLNGRYVRELFVNRGPLRRREGMVSSESLPTASTREAISEQALSEQPSAAQPASESERALPRGDASWSGQERRQTPRDRGRGSSRGSPPAEDSPRG